MNTIFLCYFFISLLFLYVLLARQNIKHHSRRAKLPPGSMGFPYVGETLKLYSQNPNDFFTSRQKRYGEIFKTSILGYPCIMLASPEAIRYVLVTQAKIFKPTYPKSKEQLIGPWALFFHQGCYHTRLRKLVESSLSLDVTRSLIPDIEAIAVSALESCSRGHVINTFHLLKKFTFDVAVLSIFGHLEASVKDMLKENYYILDEGYNSFPVEFPGSSYSKSLLARKRLRKILGEIIDQRKKREMVKNGLLGCMLKFKDENGGALTNDQISDNIIGVLFAAQDTTASLLTWTIKYIHDDVNLLESITEEQKAIYESNDRGLQPLTWAQTRNMPCTNRVILESLRMSSIISFTFREAVEDVEYKGYLIPKGWKVLPLFRNIHHNPEFFNDPHVFNPSRFEVGAKPHTFMPFGNGIHVCPGNEVAKLEILVFVHHLVNKFRWRVMGSNSGVEYKPFPVPEHGLPAMFDRKIM